MEDKSRNCLVGVSQAHYNLILTSNRVIPSGKLHLFMRVMSDQSSSINPCALHRGTCKSVLQGISDNITQCKELQPHGEKHYGITWTVDNDGTKEKTATILFTCTNFEISRAKKNRVWVIDAAKATDGLSGWEFKFDCPRIKIVKKYPITFSKTPEKIVLKKMNEETKTLMNARLETITQSIDIYRENMIKCIYELECLYTTHRQLQENMCYIMSGEHEKCDFTLREAPSEDRLIELLHKVFNDN